MLHFTKHVRKRMKERGITEQEIRYGLDNFQESFLGKKKHMNYIYTYPTGIRLRIIVHEESPDDRIIVSVMD